MKETSTCPIHIHKLFAIASMAIHNFIWRNSLHDQEFAEAIAKDDMYVCKDMPDIHLNFAAQEDIKGLLYPTMANTEDMEIVWHGIMAALQYEWEALRQPRRRQRT